MCRAPAFVSSGRGPGTGGAAAGGHAGHPVSARDARRGREAVATDRPAPGRAAPVLRAGRRSIPGSASAGNQGGPLRRPRFLLVRRAKRGGRAEAARADRFAAMMRVLLLAVLLPASAFAYDEAVHAFITRHALPLDRPVAPPTQDDLDTFRAQFWVRASEHPGFERRYPTIHDFDAWAFKEFLMLDPAARVHGFEPLPDDDAGTLHRLLERASRWPDDDERNRHRYLHDRRTREIVRAPDGSPIPYDPATLDFGSLTGTTSQGHAHYGLVEGPLSDDPEVLKKEPWRFAVPPTAHAYGVELVQLYTDLSALAAQSRLPSAVWLQAAFAGAVFHHLEDLCNQIHTVQVGIYEFLETALLESKLRDLQTLGGLFGERHSLRQVGLRLIANHHLLSEDLFAKHLGEMPLSGKTTRSGAAAGRLPRAGGGATGGIQGAGHGAPGHRLGISDRSGCAARRGRRLRAPEAADVT